MPAKPGNNYNPKGRPVGSANNTTKQIRETFAMLLEGRTEELENALNSLRDKDPKSFLDYYIRISERFVGPVSRQVMEDTEGNSIQPINIIMPPQPKHDQ